MNLGTYDAGKIEINPTVSISVATCGFGFGRYCLLSCVILRVFATAQVAGRATIVGVAGSESRK
jgi:hypothetical protein